MLSVSDHIPSLKNIYKEKRERERKGKSRQWRGKVSPPMDPAVRLGSHSLDQQGWEKHPQYEVQWINLCSG